MDRSEILKWCHKFGLKNDFTINDDGTVDVDYVSPFYHSVELTYKWKWFGGKLPIRFGKVKGNFHVDHCGLTTLEGVPKHVGGDFFCTDNKLTTLEGGPEYVGGLYQCRNNKLTTLKHMAKKVGYYEGENERDIGDGICFHDNNISNFDDFTTDFKGDIGGVRNPITPLMGENRYPNGMESDYLKWFKKLKIITDGVVDIKRLKYLRSLFEHLHPYRLDIEEIEKHYTIK